jgi:hypothetical protein
MARKLKRSAATLVLLTPELFTPSGVQLSNCLVARADWVDPEAVTPSAAR